MPAKPPLQRPQAPAALGTFSATVNGHPFITHSLSAMACLRPGRSDPLTCRIWKILATGTVRRHRTMIGLFIDETVQPGSYNLLRNEQITVIYHLTPTRMAKIYHSRDLQQGNLTLLGCDAAAGALHGNFEFAVPTKNFHVTEGLFDLVCDPNAEEHPAIRSAGAP
ncbi:hypothetical protein OKW98_10885 [Pseudomonas sp. KU26590]|uniref:hypothetical protein n=1 Tax=Pseudomonas sp. KU26590 TaxID=2991051 RepID=UPI00223E5347|nr:hypothetical protein [Pseudomonas sp. KU26590]UZJ62173.1 hypothetical protein OKW98_10885 [Pseudomonas sp. KU26590]